MKLKKIKIPDRIENISLKFFVSAPYFFEFLLRFNYYSCPDIGTMGVNSKHGSINMFINEEFLNTLTDIELQGILVHEILHLVNLHITRLGDRHQKLFNIASDICVNEVVLNTDIGGSKLELPKSNYCSKCDIYTKESTCPKCFSSKLTNKTCAFTKEFLDKHNYKGNLISEEIYSFLLETMKEKNEGGGNEGGGNEGGRKLVDNHDVMKESDEMAKETIKQIHKAGVCRGYGNISGNITDHLKSLNKSKVNWQKQLYNALKKISYEKTQFIEQTWTRVNRRNNNFQGKKYLNRKVIIAIDTSGSTGGYLQQFFTEIESILGRMENTTLIQCDCEIVDINKKYKKGDWKNIEIKGFGGTEVQPVFDYIHENKLKDHTIIYFTDGEFSFNFDKKGANVIWAVCNSYESIKVPGGNNIYITNEERGEW